MDHGYEFQDSYIVYGKDSVVDHTEKDVFSMFRGFQFRLIIIGDDLFLCIDPHLSRETNASTEYLAQRIQNLDALILVRFDHYDYFGDCQFTHLSDSSFPSFIAYFD